MNEYHYILDGKDPKQIKIWHNGEIIRKNIDLWAEWFSKMENRIVAQDYIGDMFFISTVFLGIDHKICIEKGPPVLFETMVFDEKNNRAEVDCFRYQTWDEAEAGHKRLLGEYSLFKKIDPDR